MTPGTKGNPEPLLRVFAFSILASVLITFAAGCGPKSVATVNGSPISREDFYARVLSFTRGTQPQMAAGMQILQSMVVERLVLDEAKHEGVMPTDAEVDERINLIRKGMPNSGANLPEQLQQQGLTLDALRYDMRVSLAQEKLFTKGITVTDPDVRKYYDQHKAADFSSPPLVSIHQLTVSDKKTADEAAKDVKNADFGLVAMTRSKDQFKNDGGKVGPIPRRIPPNAQGTIPQVVADKAFSMKKGQVSEPIKIGANWVIIKVDEVIPAKTEKYEEVRDMIRRNLLLQKAQQSGSIQRVEQRISQLRQQAQIDVDIDQYKNAPVFKKQPAAALPTAPGQPFAGAPPTATPGAGAVPATPGPATPAPTTASPAKNTPAVTPPAGKR